MSMLQHRLPSLPRTNPGLRTALAGLLLVQGCAVTVTATSADGGTDTAETSTVQDAAANQCSQGDVIVMNRDVDQSPTLHFYTAVEQVRAGWPVGLFANVTSGDSVLTGQIIRLQGNHADQNFGNFPYDSRRGSAGPIEMDHICMEIAGGHSVQGNYDIRTAGSWGAITVQANPCRATQLDTGWLMARYFPPRSIAIRNKVARLLATDLSIPTQPSAEVAVTVLPNEDILTDIPSHLRAIPSSTHIPVGTTFFTIITAQEGGFGSPLACYVAGVPMSTNGEDGISSGCTDEVNGPDIDNFRAETAKNAPMYPDAWNLAVNQVCNCTMVARGQGTIDTAQPWVIRNLGAGMHVLAAEATTPGRAEIGIRLRGGPTNPVMSTTLGVDIY